MQRSEFESLTGIRPTWSMYHVIEKFYMESDQDKAEFCRAYVLNIGGIAERIRYEADCEEVSQKQESECRIAELQAQLDKELKLERMNVPKKRVLELALDKLESEILHKLIPIARDAHVINLSHALDDLGTLILERQELKNELISGTENQESGKE